MPIDNFGTVSNAFDHFLTRSAQPRDIFDFDHLHDIGVRTIIKLCNDREFEDAIEIKSFTGKVYLDPLAGLFRKGDDQVVEAICGVIQHSLQDGGVHVHCTHGRDRTGLVCAAYRVVYDGAPLGLVNQERARYGVDGIIALFDIQDDKILSNLKIKYPPK